MQETEVKFQNPVKAIGYSMIYHVAVIDPELSAEALRVYLIYLMHAQQKEICWPSRERLIQLTGKSAASITRYNAELERLGYIERSKRLGQTSLTVILDYERDNGRLQELAKGILVKREDSKRTNQEQSLESSSMSPRELTDEPSESSAMSPKELIRKSNHRRINNSNTSPTDGGEGEGKKDSIPGENTGGDKGDDPIPGVEEPWRGSPPKAARVFQSRMHRWPKKASYRRIHSIVGDGGEDLEFWGDVISSWRDLGFNPMNIDGMLQCYQDRILPSEQIKKRNGKTRKGGQEENLSAIKRIRQRMAEGNNQQGDSEKTIDALRGMDYSVI